MIFLAVLAVATSVTALVRRHESPRTWARIGFGAAFVVAGIAHLVGPRPFEQHLPGWVPAPAALVIATGIVEIVLGLALATAPPHRRRTTGALGAAYLVAVWPANIYVAVAGVDVDGQPGGPYPWIRVPVQALFVAWALWSTRGDSPRRTPGIELPWVAGPVEHDDAPDPVTVMASRLELARWRDVPRFLTAALGLRNHLRSSPGAIGLALRAEPHRRRFWTLSAWADTDAMHRFTADAAHVAVMRRFGPHLRGSAFTTWTTVAPTRSDVGGLWHDAAVRLSDVASHSDESAHTDRR